MQQDIRTKTEPSVAVNHHLLKADTQKYVSNFSQKKNGLVLLHDSIICAVHHINWKWKSI